MKKSLLYTVVAGALLFSANLISPTSATASSGSEKQMGGIVLGIPSGCDCTIPANTCFCVVSKDKEQIVQP